MLSPSMKLPHKSHYSKSNNFSFKIQHSFIQDRDSAKSMSFKTVIGPRLPLPLATSFKIAFMPRSACSKCVSFVVGKKTPSIWPSINAHMDLIFVVGWIDLGVARSTDRMREDRCRRSSPSPPQLSMCLTVSHFGSIALTF